MKSILSILFVVLFSFSIFAQKESEKDVRLSGNKLKVEIIKRDFPDVPQSVREYHARGMIRVRVSVDEEGNVKKAILVSFTQSKDLKDYVEKTVAGWKFKPYEVDGERKPFTKVIEIPFCYGSFSSWCID